MRRNRKARPLLLLPEDAMSAMLLGGARSARSTRSAHDGRWRVAVWFLASRPARCNCRCADRPSIFGQAALSRSAPPAKFWMPPRPAPHGPKSCAAAGRAGKPRKTASRKITLLCIRAMEEHLSIGAGKITPDFRLLAGTRKRRVRFSVSAARQPAMQLQRNEPRGPSRYSLLNVR